MDRAVKLLLVENNLSDQALIRRLLSKARLLEFGVESTEYLSSAIMKLLHPKDGQFDLVFLDLNLEDSRGIDTVVEVYRAAPEVPIVVLSGTEDIKIAALTRDCGAVDFIVKKDPAVTPERDIVEELERKAWFAIQQHRQQLQTRALTRVSLEKAGAPDADPVLVQTCQEAVTLMEDGLRDVRVYLKLHYPDAWDALADVVGDKLLTPLRELRLQFRLEEASTRRVGKKPSSQEIRALQEVDELTTSSSDRPRPSATLEEAERQLLEALSLNPMNQSVSDERH